MSLWLSGVGVSRGIALGQVHRLQGGELEIPEYTLEPADIESEVQRFFDALAQAREQLDEIRSRIPGAVPGDIAAFIDTHLLMMEDNAITDVTVGRIRAQAINAEAALCASRDAVIAVFEQMEDPYLRTRRDDVHQVCARILRMLLKSDRHLLPRAEASREPAVIVAEDITPADILMLAQHSAVAAIITEYGGPLSHTAILARSLGVPAVVGAHGARRLLRDGERVIVDGELGHVLAAPDEQALEFFQVKQQRQARHRQRLGLLRDRPPVSRDGVRVQMLANIDQPEDALEASSNGAEGVGLYRTEFMFLNRTDLPDEEEQYEAYARAISSVSGPITMRTLDLGADKQLDTGRLRAASARNPALGLRAIRLCLHEPELFRTQVRALLRASVHGKMNIMLPMISSAHEFRQARQIIELCGEELRREGVTTADGIGIGAMIEVPAAAISAPLLARRADFFSIGTNDLIQYTLAIDRVDDEVNYLYDPLHPAVLRLISMAIQAGESAGIPVTMCGEMAGDQRYTALLLGLGLTGFSMHPASIVEVKRAVRDSNIAQLRAQAREMLACDEPEELERLMAYFM